jgi:ribonuclease HI
VYFNLKKKSKIQKAYLIFITKAHKILSNEALSAIAGIMPIEQAMQLYKDKRAISRGKPTNAVITAVKYVETPIKNRDIHPKDNYVRVGLSGAEGTASATIYTDGSKTENHVGASAVVLKDSKETHMNTARLNSDCTIFQAELYGISMAMELIQSQRKSIPACATNVDSKAALLTIANKQKTHPLATAIREKIINLRHSTSITLHWVKGHAGLKGNERANYLAKTAASYCARIAYDKIPINRGKKSLEEHYTKILNAMYQNSANASHTKMFIPSMSQILPSPLTKLPYYTVSNKPR